jgi:CDP-glucose 4,6-dehydratase
MLLAQKLSTDNSLLGQAFNFSNETQVSVSELVERILNLIQSDLDSDVRNEAVNEIRDQYLSARKAREVLGWKPLFTLDEGLRRAIDWYREFLGAGI